MEHHNTVLSLLTLRNLAGKCTCGSLNIHSQPIAMRRHPGRTRSIIEYLSWGWIVMVIVAGVVGGWLLHHNARPTLSAGPIVITTTDDELNSDGDCSLREAI